MKTTATAIKLGMFSLVILLFTAGIIVVFGQLRFDRTVPYSAIFTNASALRAGQFVRADGVEVGKVSGVALIDGGTRARVDFTVDHDLPLYAHSRAAIRYLNLLGDRFLELQRGDSNTVLPPGSTLPLSRTEPALDLDALIGGFRPLFRALDPQKVNTITQTLVTVLQGQGGTITDILDQTTQFSDALADHDQTIGAVITNLNTVLDTAVKHQQQFSATVDNFDRLVTGLKDRKDNLADSLAHISTAAGTLGDLLADNRSLLHNSVARVETTVQPLVDNIGELDRTLKGVPDSFRTIGRASGSYGDFFNFYLCDLSLELNGLQPGGPVRTAKLWGQPTGRCMPQ
jgi:phospholipid/cholesterol/gamma-HCH transport system substrate-binding protein